MKMTAPVPRRLLPDHPSGEWDDFELVALARRLKYRHVFPYRPGGEYPALGVGDRFFIPEAVGHAGTYQDSRYVPDYRADQRLGVVSDGHLYLAPAELYVSARAMTLREARTLLTITRARLVRLHDLMPDDMWGMGLPYGADWPANVCDTDKAPSPGYCPYYGYTPFSFRNFLYGQQGLEWYHDGITMWEMGETATFHEIVYGFRSLWHARYEQQGQDPDLGWEKNPLVWLYDFVTAQRRVYAEDLRHARLCSHDSIKGEPWTVASNQILAWYGDATKPVVVDHL